MSLPEAARLCAGADTIGVRKEGTYTDDTDSKIRPVMSAKAHILIVDDSAELRDAISGYLRANGFLATTAPDARTAREILKTTEISLAILDVMMPDEDGLTLCRSLRAESALPIIMLTARGDDVDRILGLELGADDYLSKPCNPRELLARIGSVLRRASMARDIARSSPRSVRFDVWQMDLEKHELLDRDGVAIPLSTGEYRLLVALLEHAKTTLSRDFLLDVTQPGGAEPYDRSIDSAISRLRRKLKDDPRAPRIIKTQYGGGYMIDVDPKWS